MSGGCEEGKLSDNTFRRIVWLSIAIVGILLYSSTFYYTGFQFDGALFLVNNPLFKDLDYYVELLNIKKFSNLDEQLGLNSDVTTNFMMRPVAYLTFSLNYMFSELNPFSYRVVNTIIHICNALLVYECIARFLSFTPSQKSLTPFSLRFIPAASAFVFLLHPMQTESVTYINITQRFASLAALFYLATIYTYLVWRWRQQQEIKHNSARWVSLLVLFLGMLTRESLFTAPIMLVLLEVTLLGNTLAGGIKRAKAHIALLPVIPLMVFMVFMVSAAQNNSSPSFSGAVNVVNYVGTPVLHYALTQLVVVITYLRLYLFPYHQNVDHDQTLYTLPYQWPVVVSGFVIIAMLTGAYFLYRRNSDDKRYTLIFVGFCWYFMGLAVSSSVIPLPDLISEHRAYFSSIGFIFALICILDLVRTYLGSARSGNIMAALVGLCCVALMIMTYNRNKVWESGILLWSNSVRNSPASHRANYNLGVAHVYAKEYSESIRHLKKSIEISPDWTQGYDILAVALINLKRYSEAIDVSIRGINIDPVDPVFYNNLGIVYIETGREEDARQAFTKALALRPGYINAIKNLDRVTSYIESSAARGRGR